MEEDLKTCPYCKENGLVWTRRELWECYICNHTYTSEQYEKLLLIEKRNIEIRNKELRKYHDEDGHTGLCPFCGSSEIDVFTSESWKCNSCFQRFPIPSYTSIRHDGG